MSWDKVRVAIQEACVRLEAEGLVAEASGNVSVRLPSKDGRDLVAITPSQVPYRKLRPEQILVIDYERNVIEGEGKPSSETVTHLTAYRARADVGAVIHSHSVYASALAVAGQEIPPLIDEQVVTLGGGVKVAEFGMSASQDLADNAVKALELRQAVLLRSHGALSVGRDLDEVLAVAALVERMAKIYILARTLGEPLKLPAKIVELEIKYYRMLHGFPAED
ncbi:MAG: class II aldolase/adducin family protein [Chloroflexi bacterium]|nr:class II aldolase/adducin family protein [Chloroflexota bacterium]